MYAARSIVTPLTEPAGRIDNPLGGSNYTVGSQSAGLFYFSLMPPPVRVAHPSRLFACDVDLSRR
jgi:hypothetical protein